MEIKKLEQGWWEKNNIPVYNFTSLVESLVEIDRTLQECDLELQEVGLGISYTSQLSRLDAELETHGRLREYIEYLPYEIQDTIDRPLKNAFNHGATETISRIRLEEYKVDNTLGLTEDYHITGLNSSGVATVTSGTWEKSSLGFMDFIGTTDDGYEGNGLSMTKATGSVAAFEKIFAEQYENYKQLGLVDESMSQGDFLTQFYTQGEFYHDEKTPFKDFVSAVLDVTIVKPLYEACTGEDLITGEDLTEFERNMKVVFAAIDLVTLGMALEANLASEMGAKELLKVAAIDFLSNTAATGVSYIGEALELPQPVTLVLSFLAGISVSKVGTSIVFKDANMNVIREVDIEDIPELENISVGKIAGEVDVGKPVAGEIETSYGKSSDIITNKFPNEEIPADGYKLDYYISDGKIKGIDGRKGNFDFVITKDGQLLIGSKHHYLGNAEDVIAAGQIKINGQGAIKRIDNLSGHYQPTVDQAMNYQALFEQQGLVLNKTWLEYYYIPIDSNGYCGDTVLEYIKMIEEVK